MNKVKLIFIVEVNRKSCCILHGREGHEQNILITITFLRSKRKKTFKMVYTKSLLFNGYCTMSFFLSNSLALVYVSCDKMSFM